MEPFGGAQSNQAHGVICQMGEYVAEQHKTREKAKLTGTPCLCLEIVFHVVTEIEGDSPKRNGVRADLIDAAMCWPVGQGSRHDGVSGMAIRSRRSELALCYPSREKGSPRASTEPLAYVSDFPTSPQQGFHKLRCTICNGHPIGKRATARPTPMPICANSMVQFHRPTL
jgi:hypothetical protein